MEDFNQDPKIDKGFLELSLGNNQEVLSYVVTPGSKPGDNYMSVIYSIDVELRDKSSNKIKTRHLLLKCYPTHPSRQEFNHNTNFFHRELETYRLWIPELQRFQTEDIGLKNPYKLPFTHLVAGKSIDFTKLKENEKEGLKLTPLDNFIMMDDLRKTGGFRSPCRKDPLDIHHMRLAIPAIAKIHALGWVYKNRVTKDILEKYPFLRVHLHDGATESWGTLAETNMDEEIKTIEEKFGPTSEVTKGLKNFKKYMKPLMRSFCGDYQETLFHEIMRVKNYTRKEHVPEPWIVMIHGDCWSTNMLFRYDSNEGLPEEVTLIDLQLIREGCITIDLIHLIYSSTTTEFRSIYLNEILELYFYTFNDVCSNCKCPSLPGFSLETFRDRFHRGKVLGCSLGLLMYPLMLKDEEKVVNMESIDDSKDFGELLLDAGGGSIMNELVTERVTSLVQEMYDDGIL